MPKLFRTLTLCLMLSLSLSGCAVLAIGGAAAVGGLTLTDRRSAGAQADDQIMELSVKNQIDGYLSRSASKGTSVSVTSYNRNILLLGVVATEEERTTAERIARTQQPVQHIHNYITVGGTRTADAIARDSWTTSKIRTMLLKPRGFAPNHVKVVTYNNITYAMGILTTAEQAAATAEISTTTGVQKVVTLYETFTPASHP